MAHQYPSNPYAPPNPDEAKLERFSKFQDVQNRQAEADALQQHGMIQQLMQLYSMSTEAQKQPGQLQAQNLENQQRQMTLEHMPTMWAQEATRSADTSAHTAAELPYLAAETQRMTNENNSFPTTEADRHAKAMSDLQTASSTRALESQKSALEAAQVGKANAWADAQNAKNSPKALQETMQSLAYMQSLPKPMQKAMLPMLPDSVRGIMEKQQQAEKQQLIPQILHEPDPAKRAQLQQLYGISDEALGSPTPQTPQSEIAPSDYLGRVLNNSARFVGNAAMRTPTTMDLIANTIGNAVGVPHDYFGQPITLKYLPTKGPIESTGPWWNPNAFKQPNAQ